MIFLMSQDHNGCVCFAAQNIGELTHMYLLGEVNYLILMEKIIYQQFGIKKNQKRARYLSKNTYDFYMMMNSVPLFYFEILQ